jgi:CysZ protein
VTAELHARSGSVRLGFMTGVASLPRAFAEVSRTPELRALAVVPSLLLVILTGVTAAASVFEARPWFVRHLPEATSSLGRAGESVAGWFLAALLAWLGWYVALTLAPVLSAPALERIVQVVERAAGAPPRAPLGFWRELGCGLRSLTGALCVALPLYALLWLVGFVFPPATVVTLPLGAFVGTLLVAWSLFDYPLTLRGFGFRARLALMRENFACVAGFGAAFALAFTLPCCAVVLLPVGAVAATRLTSRLVFQTPA